MAGMGPSLGSTRNIGYGSFDKLKKEIHNSGNLILRGIVKRYIEEHVGLAVARDPLDPAKSTICCWFRYGFIFLFNICGGLSSRQLYMGK